MKYSSREDNIEIEDDKFFYQSEEYNIGDFVCFNHEYWHACFNTTYYSAIIIRLNNDGTLNAANAYW